MCGGGGGAPPPPPLDPKAQELEQMQLDLLNEQARQQSIFQPLQAEQSGYTPIYGPDPRQQKIFDQLTAMDAQHPEGWRSPERDALTNQLTALGYSGGGGPSQVIVGYQKTDARTQQEKQIAELQSAQMATAQKANDALNKYLDSLDTEDYKAYQKAQQDLQAQQTQIAIQQGERTQKALKGELPLSEGTIQRKAQDFQLLKENLARSGNAIIGDDPSSAYSLSSPGSQALKEFNLRYGAIEDQERQGQLDTGTQAYIQAVDLSGKLNQTDRSNAGGLSGPGGYAATSASLNPASTPVQNNVNLIQGYSNAINPYLQQQQQLYNYQLAGYIPSNSGYAGAAGGAMSGAAAGTAISPGWGTAGGAVIGGLAGYIGTKH